MMMALLMLMCTKTKGLIKMQCVQCEIELLPSKLDFPSNLCANCMDDLMKDLEIEDLYEKNKSTNQG